MDELGRHYVKLNKSDGQISKKKNHLILITLNNKSNRHEMHRYREHVGDL